MMMISIYFETKKNKSNIFNIFNKLFGKNKPVHISDVNILWFDDFYIKYLDDILEIIIFNKCISCDEVLNKIYKDILLGEEAMIKIRNGDIEYHFWANKHRQEIGV